MDFRKASARDASKIAALEEKYFSDPWSERSVSDCICTEGSMCYVAYDGDNLVAYWLGRLIAPEGEIYRIAVNEKYRRRGIAYRLLDYGTKCARGSGLETLFLEVRARNTAAYALYCAFGFRTLGIRKDYYKDPSDDAVMMIKDRA